MTELPFDYEIITSTDYYRILMDRLPFYCKITDTANYIEIFLEIMIFIIPIIPAISLIIALVDIFSLRVLKDSYLPKEQLQERKRILIKGIIYASILPIIYLWFLSQDLMNFHRKAYLFRLSSRLINNCILNMCGLRLN